MAEPTSTSAFVKHIDDLITNLIESDPLLNHLPTDITTEELNAITDQEHGLSIIVHVVKEDDSLLAVIVRRDSTVLQLKKTFEKQLSLWIKRNKPLESSSKVNWKNFWKTHAFVFNGQKMTEDGVKIKEIGLHNNCQVFFARINKKKH